jgi:integrase
VALKMRELSLPKLEKFMKHPGLPVAAVVPEPVKGDGFSAMLKAVGDLPADDVRGTINLILRQTGMRSGSLVALHRDWVEQFEDGYTLHVRTVKGGTAEYSIPVTDEVAELVLGRDGFTLPGDERERRRAVETHSTWVKTVIGATDSASEQGNHRLRDTVASIAFSWLGRDAAVEMLGNGREVNKRHYARLRINVTAEMKHELRAVRRLRPENVVELPGQKVA